MAFIFVCGTHTFQSLLQGYENVTVQCQNCGNISAHVYKRWEWFTFCFVPVIPFSIKPWKEVGCHICNFYQDIKYRPDVTSQHGGLVQGQSNQGNQGYQMGGYRPGGPPGPPGGPQGPGQPVYK